LEHKPNTCYDKVKDVNILLKEFYLTVHKFKIKDIICIDETSLSSFLIRNYGYSKKRKRYVIQTNNQNVFKKYIQEFYFIQFIQKVVWIVIGKSIGSK
jgi:hypothetical protein